MLHTYLASTHGQGCERILEDLLKAQELDHTQGDSGVEAQATLVGTNGAAELQDSNRHDWGRVQGVAVQ